MNSYRYGRCFFFAALLLCSASLTAQEVIEDPTFKFTLKLPNGFKSAPQLVNQAERIIHAFILGDPNDQEFDIYLFIQQMRGAIGQERLKSEAVPPGFQGRLFTTQWQGFEVDAFEVPERAGEIEAITYNVQIPLQRTAIQVKLFGPTDRKADLERLLREVLDGLTGESNWSSSPLAGVAAKSSENYGYFLLACAIIYIIGGLVMFFVISKRAPKGVVLLIAGVIYFASYGLDGTRVREILMLSGATRMLGFIGGILGIVDFLRKRPPQNKAGGQPNAEPEPAGK